MKCRHGINLTNMQCNACNVAMDQDPSLESLIVSRSHSLGLERHRHQSRAPWLYEYTDVEIYDLSGSIFTKWLESCPVKFSVGAVDMGGTRADVMFWIDDE